MNCTAPSPRIGWETWVLKSRRCRISDPKWHQVSKKTMNPRARLGALSNLSPKFQLLCLSAQNRKVKKIYYYFIIIIIIIIKIEGSLSPVLICALAPNNQYPWRSEYAGVFVMQFSSQMANAGAARPRVTQCDPGPPAGTGPSPSSSLPVFSSRGEGVGGGGEPAPGISSHVPDWSRSFRQRMLR